MGCHTAIVNPPGYVMENYDAIGAWQTVDKLGGGPIDRSRPSTSATATRSRFTTPRS